MIEIFQLWEVYEPILIYNIRFNFITDELADAIGGTIELL